MDASSLTRILIIDDDEDDFLIISSIIKSIPDVSFVMDWCASYGEALNRVCEKRHDLYFVDYYLGGRTALDLLFHARSCGADAPIILLTGRGNRSISLQALEYGAADYLVKSDLDAEKLERCIRYSLEKSKALKELKHSEGKFRSMFEKIGDGMFMANMQWELQEVNSAMSRITGYTASELCNMSLPELMSDEKQVVHIQQLLAEKQQIPDLEIGVYHQSGDHLDMLLSSVVISGPDGTAYIQGVLHDITKLRKTERSLLISEKLATAGRLARTLAHEIRNPLTNIQLALAHINNLSGEEDNAAYLEIINRGSLRISDMLNQLLASSSTPHYRMREEVLQNIVDKSLQAAADRMLLKQLRLQVNYSERPVRIRADAEKLSLALLNLLINATEAMKENTGRLMVAVEDHTDHAMVRITDDGIGIPPNELSRLFDPYYTTKRNGLGLGLAATLNILEAHRAQIDVNSVEKVGTTFSIQFPVLSE